MLSYRLSSAGFSSPLRNPSSNPSVNPFCNPFLQSLSAIPFCNSAILQFCNRYDCVMRRGLPKAIAIVVVCLALACGAAYAYLARSLPEIDGQVSTNGLSSSIDIIRDADAIPHIFATNVPDALFGLGYVHAQDRLWQMEFERRVGHGRLSEI